MILRRPKVGLILLAGAGMIALAPWIWVKSLEVRRWKQLERRVDQLRAELEARGGPRPVLRGTPIPGNAWDDYLPAIEAVPTADERLGETYRSEVLRQVVTAYAPLVDGLRRGTRRAEVRRFRIHERGPHFNDLEDGWPSRLLVLGDLAVFQARLLAQDDKPRQAAELLLEVCKYAEDVTRDGSSQAHWLGTNIASDAFIELDRLMMDGRLSAEDCRALEPELVQLDERLPGFDPVLLGLMEQIGTWMLNGYPVDKIPTPTCMLVRGLIDPGWRYGYSQPLLMVAAFDETESLLTPLLKAGSGSAAEETALLAKVAAGRDASLTGYVRVFLEHLPDSSHLRSTRAHLRVLRMAARYVATGEILELADPHGTKLHHGVDGNRIRFWSVGGDGIDHGGNMADRRDDILEIPLRR